MNDGIGAFECARIEHAPRGIPEEFALAGLAAHEAGDRMSACAQTLDECRAELGAGIVGTGASAELMARVDAIAMHDVEAILSGTEKVVVTDSQVDRLISLPSAIVMHLDELRKDTSVDTAVLDRAVEVMVHLAENDLPDAAVPSLSALKPMFPHYRPSEKLAARYGKVVSSVMGA